MGFDLKGEVNMFGIFNKKEPEQPKGLEIVETDKPFDICFNGVERGYIHKDENGIYRAVFKDFTQWASHDLRKIEMYVCHLNNPSEGETNE